MPTPNEERLQLYLDAEKQILGGQSVRVNQGGTDRELRLPDLAEVRAQIAVLERAVAAERRGACGRNRSFSQANFG